MTQILSTLATFIDDIPGVYQPQDDLETTIAELAMNTVFIAASTLIVLTLLAVVFSKRFEKVKMPLFILMAFTMASSTLILIGSTVYLNVQSDSGGPVHWHADHEFWVCGNEIELRDPTGFLSNKIGTATLHEHDDHRVHLEGVVVEEEIDASLGKYMHVVGGAITAEQMVIPLNADGEGNLFEDEEDGDGPAITDPDAVEPFIIDDVELGKVLNVRDGDSCNDVVSDVQVFVYNYDEETKTYEQTKLDNPRDYVIYEDPNVPPGDCIIFEFGPEREKTDKLCAQYGIRDIERCEQFGVEPNQREICELTQTNFESSDTLPVLQTEGDDLEPQQEVDAELDSVSTETTSGDADAVHLSAETENARIACEESGDENSDACVIYNDILSNDPGAQAEADAAGDPGTVQEESSTDQEAPVNTEEVVN